MNSMSIPGRWLLLAGLVLGVLALVGMTAVALAAAPENPGSFSITLPVPYAKVVDAVREVGADGVIRGTAQYESETTLTDADEASSSTAFPRWTGPGEVFFKIRPKTIAPSNFTGSQDQGTVTVRYVVEPGSGDSARITIDAIFVESTHHGRHASKGLVERAEFAAVAKLLKNAGSTGSSSHVEAQPRPADPPKAQPKAGAGALQARAYALPEQPLKTALKELGAFEDVALPMLEGFAAVEPEQMSRFDRPHYQFSVQFEPGPSGRTSVKIEARISARYSEPGATRFEYRSVPSNGRLETDLLDRLESYLSKETTNSTPDAASARDKIAGLAGKQ